MSCLVAIRIPEEFTSSVMAFCRARQYTPSDLTITLIEPSLLEDLPGVEQKLQSFCLAQTDFNIVVAGPSCYGDKLLYLHVLPGMITMVRSNLLAYLKVNPKTKIYRPHLTIMRSQTGREHNLNQLLAEAKTYFAVPYSFTVSQIELYIQQHAGAPYKPNSVIPFTGR